MVSDTTTVAIPSGVRLLLGRAAVQVIANREGVDLLHIKGHAVDPSLRDPLDPGASGTDVDVMVRPEHATRMDVALRRRGWSVYSTYLNGSPFGHAQTYLHEAWGYLDLHRSFPGVEVDASDAFAILWSARSSVTIAGVECPVPSVSAQALILILNAARAPSKGTRDVAAAWEHAGPMEHSAIERLASDLEAHVAMAAAIGRLEDFRDHHSYRLWRAVSQGGTRSEEWWGRLRAARTWRERARLARQLSLVNTEHLAIRLGHAPTSREVAVEFIARPSRAVREWVGSRRGGSRS
ncbi:nucleotidyltransferase family protein [Microbacterium sp.]|uniref:nucleotidyltransferase family protein n=1 Tax=Microbacterium sp. TaxID=51671 RepID=UPI003C1DFBA1